MRVILTFHISEHEFEAEGPQEAVERQFEAFKEIVASFSQSVQAQGKPSSQLQRGVNSKPTPTEGTPGRFQRIFRVGGRVVSLTAPPQDPREAALLIILGQKLFRANETPTGSEIIDGLRQSGYNTGDRVDRLLEGYLSDGLVIRMGVKKGTRYRLSNTGMPRAEAIAEQAESILP